MNSESIQPDYRVESAATPPSRFDRFRQLVLRDPTLFDRLCQASEPAAFVALVVRLSEDRGCGVVAQDVTCEMQAGATRLYRPDEAVCVADLAGWTPIGLSWEQGRARLDWCRLGHISFIDSFFDQTVERAL